ncbi:MAG TPA: hypothetical protein VFD03_11015, partial [Clostridia bacterium]|nr:hypothetical protein [Clostridia bacterium]
LWTQKPRVKTQKITSGLILRSRFIKHVLMASFLNHISGKILRIVFSRVEATEIPLDKYNIFE